MVLTSQVILTLISLITSLYVHFTNAVNEDLYSNTWAIQIDGGKAEADRIATKHGYTNTGQIGSLEGFYLFRHTFHPRRSKRSLDEKTKQLFDENKVRWAKQQIIKRRVKRDYSSQFNDPYFPKQWFLHNTLDPYQGYDHNVQPVWKQGIYGTDVVVSILDDGIEYTHSDLKQNYDAKASWDFNANDDDPMPRATWNDENRHGTRCAGEVAAQFNNSICTVGVAPKAKIGGVRMLDGDVTDAVEASSLSLASQHIEIYSASWGPDDDGRTVDGPAQLARKAFLDGITKGRGGLGSIYVWASGNGGRANDNCNCDGYTNSIYTLSISSATEHGKSPWYSEACSSTLATTFSSGSQADRKIVTTDLGNTCTTSHTGTSASAPLAAGILALVLEVNRNLTWRDMQHLVVRTAKMDKLNSDDIVVNGVGRRVSHRFGYGLLDAEALVKLARRWRNVPQQHACREIPDAEKRVVPRTEPLIVQIKAEGCQGTSNHVQYLEHVEAVISLTFSSRGGLELYLNSPSGTRSMLLARRIRDNSKRGFYNWAFMTTHSWEENPAGTWTLEIRNRGSSYNTGFLDNWSLVFYGTSEDPNPVESRKQPVPACDIECQGGCEGPQPNQCTECRHLKRNLTNECVSSCSAHEYTDSVLRQCMPCSPTCDTCDGANSTDCLGCLAPLLLMNGKCINICPQGWFKLDSKCMKCANTCQACASTTTRCISCSSSHKLVDSHCHPKCLSGQFSVNYQCLACHPSCLECSKGGPWSCTKCGNHSDNDILFLHNGACLKACPPGTYVDAGRQKCQKCDSKCSSCFGPGPADCVSCVYGLYRLGDPHGSCRKSCPQGHFSQTSVGVCAPCSKSCASCEERDSTKCTSCYDDRYLDNLQCVAAQKCSNGTYANSSSNICEKCSNVCSACTGIAKSQCSACIHGYYLFKSTCVTRCPKNFFSSNGKTCQRCPDSCRTCHGAKQCLTCKHSFVLYGSACLSHCPVGTYLGQAHNQCLDCHPYCGTCRGSSLGDCLSCKDGWVLNGTSCVPKCPEGEYFTNNACRTCNPTCLSCTGPTNKDCSNCRGVKFLNRVTNTCSYECPDGFFGEAETAICKPCSPGCKSCHSSDICTSCKGHLVLNGRICQSHCSVGMHVSRQTKSCQKCDSSCLECIEKPDYCTKCHQQQFLRDHKCTDICPAGEYLVQQTKKCGKCHESCVECSAPTSDDCIKCSSSHLKVGGRCLKSCPSSYFYNSVKEQCEPCDYYCALCKDGNGLQNCSRCIPPFVLHTYYCVRECPKQGWFLDTNTQACTKCHSSCRSCIGPTSNDCITCSNPSTALDGFSCRVQCVGAMFKNLQTKLCQKCHPSCGSCAGPGLLDCTSCIRGLVLHKKSGGKGDCVSHCKTGKYKDGSLCGLCHSSCKSCYGSGANNCLSCHSSQVFSENACRESCPTETYMELAQDTRQCRKCHAICKTCNGMSADKCSSCSSNLFLENSTCVIRCSSKSISNDETRTCQPCGDDCPGVPGRPRNRSIQDPSVQALQILLDDPKHSGLLVYVIMSIMLCFALFAIVFGVLQLHSMHICRTRQYTIIKARFDNKNSEDEKSLMDSECDEEAA